MTNPTVDTPAPPPAFLKRLAEFENAVELSGALANQVEQLERRYLGPREDGQNDTGGPAHVPASLNDALEVHAINLKIALERMSYSLARLDDASIGIPLTQEPMRDGPPSRVLDSLRGVSVDDSPTGILGEDYPGPPY